MNRQRKVIYGERREVLEGADMHEQMVTMIDDIIASYVRSATAEGFPEDWDLDQLWTDLRLIYPVGVGIDDVEDEAGGGAGRRAQSSWSTGSRCRDRRTSRAREAELGDEVMRELERRVLLTVLDRKWREHLYEMDYLREGIGLRAMAQRDPLVEYQREGFDMFAAMMEGIKEEAVGFLFNLDVQVAGDAHGRRRPERTPQAAGGPSVRSGCKSRSAPMASSRRPPPKDRLK